jgi:hypothetical protein
MPRAGCAEHTSVDMRRRRESGQAAVETALTMPLTLFMVLGSLQLFMLLQGRLMAEHAVYKAVRSGVVNYGDCTAMTHAAVAALLPSFATFLSPTSGAPTPAAAFAEAFRLRTQGKPDDNRFDPVKDAPHDRAIVWIYRESPKKGDLSSETENDFDDPDRDLTRGAWGYRLEVRMIYWFPLRIPFANWVMSRMFLAHFQLQRYTAANPLMPTQKRAAWYGETDETIGRDRWPGGDLGDRMVRWSNDGHFLFPIQVNAAMRMMTPVMSEYFQGGPACALHGS